MWKGGLTPRNLRSGEDIHGVIYLGLSQSWTSSWAWRNQTMGFGCRPNRDDSLPSLALVNCASRELGFCVMREGRESTLLSQVRDRGETWAGGSILGGREGVASKNLGWCDTPAFLCRSGKVPSSLRTCFFQTKDVHQGRGEHLM